jgi:hypothetical protein
MERAPKSGHRDHRDQEHQAVSSRRDLPVQFEIAAALNCAAVSIVQTVRGSMLEHEHSRHLLI